MAGFMQLEEFCFDSRTVWSMSTRLSSASKMPNTFERADSRIVAACSASPLMYSMMRHGSNPCTSGCESQKITS